MKISNPERKIIQPSVTTSLVKLCGQKDEDSQSDMPQIHNLKMKLVAFRGVKLANLFMPDELFSNAICWFLLFHRGKKRI